MAQFKLSGVDQEYKPVPPTLEEMRGLVGEWMRRDPHQVKMYGIYLPIHAMKRTRMNPPGCADWKKFSPLWQSGVLKASEKYVIPYSGNTNYKFELADDKAFCRNPETGMWRISESWQIERLVKCEADYDIQHEMEGYEVEFNLKFIGIYPWMLKYPDIFQTADKINRNGSCMKYDAFVAKDEKGKYFIKTLERDLKVNW